MATGGRGFFGLDTPPNYVLENPMARRRTIDGGKTRAFYLGRWHLAALRHWGARRGIEGDSAILQAILELVAKAEGVPPDALADPDAPALPQETA